MPADHISMTTEFILDDAERADELHEQLRAVAHRSTVRWEVERREVPRGPVEGHHVVRASLPDDVTLEQFDAIVALVREQLQRRDGILN